jgi:hypothetical protein
MKSNFRTLLSITFWFTVIATPLRAGEQLYYLSDGKPDAITPKRCSIGWHRVEIARHYSTDIYAGRILAQVIKN